jgi:hypothetical protein
MAFEDRLYGPFAKAENLPAAFREQLFRIEGKPQLLGMFRYHESDR